MLGVGKRSLFKILSDLEEYDKGTLSFGPYNIKLGYFNQNMEFDEDAAKFCCTLLCTF